MGCPAAGGELALGRLLRQLHADVLAHGVRGGLDLAGAAPGAGDAEPGEARMCGRAHSRPRVYPLLGSLPGRDGGVVGALVGLVRNRQGQAGAWCLSRCRPQGVLAMVRGALFLPWAQVFVFQALHTGTPWSVPPGPADLLRVFGYFAGVGPVGRVAGLCPFGLVALGLFAMPVRARPAWCWSCGRSPGLGSRASCWSGPWPLRSLWVLSPVQPSTSATSPWYSPFSS